MSSGNPQPAASATPRVACLGGAVLDRKYRVLGEVVLGTSNPAAGFRSFGGVARNVAESLLRLGVDVCFISAVGADDAGSALIAHLQELGADTSGVQFAGSSATAEYAAILDPSNDLVLGIADMAIFDELSPPHLDRCWPQLSSAHWVFSDCNPPAETLDALIARSKSAGFSLAIDTVSAPKALRLPHDLSGVDLLFTNGDEAAALLGFDASDTKPSLQAVAAGLLERGAATAIVTAGATGYAVATQAGVSLMPAIPAHTVDITGAGDAMIAGTLFRLLAGDDVQNASRTGALLATLTTESAASVRQDLSPEFLAAASRRLTERVSA